MNKKSIIKKCMGKGGPIGKVVTRVEDKGIDTASKIISFPSRYLSKLRGEKLDRNRKTVREARAYDNAPDEADGGKAGRLRFMSDLIKERMKKTGK